MDSRPTVDAAEAPAAVPSAPAVVAVLVTFDPGPWLEEVLLGLAAQDYPELSVLVIDAASEVDPTSRIAATLPTAYVRRLDENRGFAASANEVIGLVEGASHYLLLHDDAAPDPDAIRLLVEEAYRSNAGVVAPKLVEWDDSRRLLAVGASADKAGVVRPYGRHELDQEQHDSVRDVFVAPGGATLVRADLFEALGGFDPDIVLMGEDLDLSWRAQLAGARVIVAPSARFRHREATASGERDLALGDAAGDPNEALARLQLRHRLRAVLKTYSGVHLVRVVPQLIVLMTLEALASLVQGRRRLAGAVFDAWQWNLGRHNGLRQARRTAQAQRTLRDSEVRRLQTRGSLRLSSALEGGLAVEERTLGVGAAGRQFAGSIAAGGLRQTLLVWFTVALVLAFGSRGLLTGRFPAVGQFQPFPDSPFTLLGQYLSGWRSSGLGADAPAPPAFAVLGLAGMLLVGAMGVLQRVLVLGLLPLGLVGMHRLTAPLGSWRVRLAGVILYAAVPLPYDALARGRLGGLVAYAAAPWILSRLLRATGLEPFGAPARDEAVIRRVASVAQHDRPTDEVAADELPLGAAEVAPARLSDTNAPSETVPGAVRHPGTLFFQSVALAAVLALSGAFAPSITLATILAGAGLVLGSLVVGQGGATVRALSVAFVASVGAGVLLVPWTLDLVLPGASWNGLAGFGPAPADARGLGEILRFGVGPFGRSPLTWGILVVALLPLLLGRRWRFEWAARLWFVAVAAWSASWALGRGWLGLSPPAVDILLAPGAAALVLAAVLGLSAFEIDLPAYRFGWRQALSLAAAAAAVVATLPVLAGTIDGRWRLPERDVPQLLSWMPEHGADGAFRVLWAGDPRLLPLDGWRLDEGLAYATSRGGPPDLTDLWPAGDSGATGLLGASLDVARRGETSRLGHLLAPMGVRYITVPLLTGTGAPRPPSATEPDDLLAALRAQVDLKLVESEDAVVVYENVAWAPAVAVLPASAVEASRLAGPEAARTTELAGATAALTKKDFTRFEGAWPGPELYFAEAYSPRWSFDAATPGSHRKAFGWANAWTAPAASKAVLRYRTSPVRYAGLLLQLGLWAFAGRTILLGIRRRNEAST